MKILSAAVLLLISSNSFAGLFGDSFTCDTDVPFYTYSNRVIGTSTRSLLHEEIKYLKSEQATHKDLHEAQQEALKKMDLKKMEEVTSTRDFRVDTKTCTAKLQDSKILSRDPSLIPANTLGFSLPPTYTGKIIAINTTILVICSGDKLDVLSVKEREALKCSKAMECVSNANNSKAALKLKDEVCGKNSDSISGEVNTHSGSRSMIKDSKEETQSIKTFKVMGK
jgi:hypothetical protein